MERHFWIPMLGGIAIGVLATVIMTDYRTGHQTAEARQDDASIRSEMTLRSTARSDTVRSVTIPISVGMNKSDLSNDSTRNAYLLRFGSELDSKLDELLHEDLTLRSCRVQTTSIMNAMPSRYEPGAGEPLLLPAGAYVTFDCPSPVPHANTTP